MAERSFYCPSCGAFNASDREPCATCGADAPPVRQPQADEPAICAVWGDQIIQPLMAEVKKK